VWREQIYPDSSKVGLEAEGFVVLGGPLEGTSDFLLIFRARTAGEILDRLSADP